MITHGPYSGQMIYGEVTHGGLKRVFVENVDGSYQGALFRFTQGLERGSIAWFRDPMKRYMSEELALPETGGRSERRSTGYSGRLTTKISRLKMLAVRVKTNGWRLIYAPSATRRRYESARLRSATLAVCTNRIVWWAEGGPRSLMVESATVSSDRRRVFLEIPELEEERVVYIHQKGPFATEENEQLWTTEAWYTLNRIPTDEAGQVAVVGNESGLSDDERKWALSACLETRAWIVDWVRFCASFAQVALRER